MSAVWTVWIRLQMNYSLSRHMTPVYNEAVLRECTPPPRRLTSSTKSSGIRIRINPNPDVCRIAPRMSWIHYLVGVGRFAECRENWPVTVWEMRRNLPNSTIQQQWGKWKTDPESISGTAAPPKLISSSDW